MRFRILLFAVTAVALAVWALGGLRAGAVVPRTGHAGTARHGSINPNFNSFGDVVIADQFNNRIVEVNPDTHAIVWQFGDGSNVASPTSVVGPNDAERVGSLTLVSGTGVPAASPPFEPGCDNGCPDNRVMVIDSSGNISWQYGQAGVTGSRPDELNTPVAATFVPSGDVLISDQGNQRIIEVTISKRIVWQYGKTGVAGSGPNELNNPNSAELLANGNILIADESNNRVIEVDRAHKIVWQYGSPNDPMTLNGAAFASRLPNGDTLITDSNNNRILEVDAGKNVVWTYATNQRPGSIANPLPTRAVRLKDGLTLISDQFNDDVIAVQKTGPSKGKIVWEKGRVNHDGDGPALLNAPYDAKVVGDFTGLTAPPQQL